MATSIESLVMTVDLGEQERSCEKHGQYISSGKKFTVGKGREVWTMCPSCRDEMESMAETAKQELTLRSRQQELEKKLNQTAIPKRFLDRGFDNWVAANDAQVNALRIAQEYVANFDSHHANGKSLIFSGGPGTGKSHLATAILRGILPRHVGVYLTFMGMIRLIRETWHPSSTRKESEVIADLGTLPLLVIDEIGVQYGTDAEHTLLFEVMDRRYRDQLPTILLTNQDTAGFKRFVGDRVYDRLRETARWVSFDWDSYRARARRGQQ